MALVFTVVFLVFICDREKMELGGKGWLHSCAYFGRFTCFHVIICVYFYVRVFEFNSFKNNSKAFYKEMNKRLKCILNSK